MEGGGFMSDPGFDLHSLMLSRREEMTVRVMQRGGTVSVNLYDELSVDENDLSTELVALPAQIAYWAVVIGKYEQLYSKLQRQFDLWYAEEYEKMFALLEKETGRKPNISSAEYMVLNRNRTQYTELKEELEQVKADLDSIKGMNSALNAKARCLQVLAQRQASEYNTTDLHYKEKVSRQASSEAALEETKNVLRGILSKKKGEPS